jgi:NAD-dependent dihydropyrimidine dehydrogenase PreA subunit
MPYVIGDPCVESCAKSCVDVCPVDCIYEGSIRLWIHPEECIDCGACEPECPVVAILYADKVHPTQDLLEAQVFFQSTLPNRDSPLGSPRGASLIGPLGTDLPRVLELGRRKAENGDRSQ